MIKRAEGVTLERAARVFVEAIHSLHQGWYAYHAVWAHDLETRFPLINQPILILQPHELLLEETREAHRDLLPQADMIELPEIIDDIFDTGPEEIGASLTGWLDATG